MMTKFLHNDVFNRLNLLMFRSLDGFSDSMFLIILFRVDMIIVTLGDVNLHYKCGQPGPQTFKTLIPNMFGFVLWHL